MRQATKQNIPTIVQIHKKCISETNSKAYNKEVIEKWLIFVTEENVESQFYNSTWLVILEENNIVGFAQYDLNDSGLYQIQIDPTYQGKGYGKLLYKYIEDDFIKNNKDKVSLNATLNAVPFYKSQGFKELSNISYNGIDMVVMEKNLK